jgi:uncharacterized membrane protein YedE/YeeE
MACDLIKRGSGTYLKEKDMDLNGILLALGGGALIGGAATMLLAMDGKVLGVSGIVGGLMDHKLKDRPWRWSFVLGLLTVGALAHLLFPSSLGTTPTTSLGVIAAGLLVGFGTRLGNGCTSGHGVCGISRFSIRSLAATMTFMLAGILAASLFHL